MENRIHNELVSIIMPVYSVEKYIRQSIESVINQTYKDWELLIMDDCSKDSSYQIMEEYAAKDERIKIHRAEKNKGVVKVRNSLTQMANGRYIAFLDSDDLWMNEKLEKQLLFMKKHDAKISCTEYTRVNETNDRINDIIVIERIKYSDLLKNNYLGCLTVIYDASAIGKREFKERDKNEDYVLWLDIIKDVKIIYGLKEKLAMYRVLSNSRSSNKIDAAKVRWEIYRKYEKLSLLKSMYYFTFYAVKAVTKNLKK